MWNSEKSGRATSRMWLNIARELDRIAREAAANSEVKIAVEVAEFADAAYWQATGEGDFRSVRDLLKKEDTNV